MYLKEYCVLLNKCVRICKFSISLLHIYISLHIQFHIKCFRFLTCRFRNSQYHDKQITVEHNLQEPCVLYIGRAYRYPPDVAFYIYFQQIQVLSILNMLHTLLYLFIFFQNAIYFIMLPFLVHVLFKFYIQSVLKFKCKTPVPKG
jgi:hypothetical protein